MSSTKTAWPYDDTHPSNKAPSVKATIYLRDFEGENAMMTFYYPSSGFEMATAQSAIDKFLVELDSQTLAAVVSYDLTFRFGWNESLGTSGIEYGNSDDKAHLVLVNSNSGATQVVNLPAPLKANFIGDTETYLTGSNIQTAMVTAGFSDGDGNGAGGVKYERGYLRRKTHKTHPRGFASEMGAD
jgi:hypothetical protein